MRSPRLSSLWAKSGDETGYLNLPQHLLDSACVAAAVYEAWVSDQLKRNLGERLGLDESELKQLYVWLAGVHDIGKGTLTFQRQVERKDGYGYLVTNVSDAGLPVDMGVLESELPKMPHGTSSGILLQSWLEAKGMPVKLSMWLASVVDAHHGMATSNELRTEIRIVLSGYPEEWSEVHSEVLDAMADLARIGPVLEKLSDRDYLMAGDAQLLTGLVVIADWIASNADSFPMMLKGGQSQRVAEGMGATDLTAPWSPFVPDLDTDRLYQRSFAWGDDQSPREIQKAMVDVVRNMERPSLVILEAETGVGKTEAALVAAHVLGAKFSSQGVYFAAPTMATANGLLDRTVLWAGHSADTGSVSSLYLAHSKNELVDSYQKVRFAGINPEEGGESNVVASSWMRGRRKGLLSNIVVGTVDQVLMLALQQRYSMLRHIALAGKIIIFDEVHSYDTYTSDYLKTALEWLAFYGVPVILMSATLPPQQREELVEAYTGNPVVERSHAYPLITVADESGLEYVTPEASPTNLEARIDIIDDDVESLTRQLEIQLADGGCALIVCNTISRAQGCYLAVKDVYPGEVELHHAGFTSRDRVKKEDRLREELGPQSHRGAGRPYRKIVVATQVAEQSLDIDADVLFTDLAPMDLLIQRIGRLHRHARPESDRPGTLRDPRVFVRGILALDPPEIEGGTEAIYDPLIVLSTLAHLPKLFTRPDDVAALVAAVYSPDNRPQEGWEDVWAEAEVESEQRKKRAHERSKTYRMPSPFDAKTMQEFFAAPSAVVSAQGSDERGAAQVRDVEPAVEVIPVIRSGDSYGPVDGSWSVHDEFDMQPWQARYLAAGTVRLPVRMTRNDRDFDDVVSRLERDTPLEWDKHYLLKGELALGLDETGRIRIGRFEVRYSEELGIEILNE
ncbi:CRISPR-associated helicase Cas3' [Corynebacterium aquatimens]